MFYIRYSWQNWLEVNTLIIPLCGLLTWYCDKVKNIYLILSQNSVMFIDKKLLQTM